MLLEMVLSFDFNSDINNLFRWTVPNPTANLRWEMLRCGGNHTVRLVKKEKHVRSPFQYAEL